MGENLKNFENLNMLSVRSEFLIFVFSLFKKNHGKLLSEIM